MPATSQSEEERKKVDKELAAWAPGIKLDNMEEFNMKTQKAIEESFKRLPPLPDNFRRPGGDRMIQFEEKGQLGGVQEHVRHIKAPWQMFRGEARPTEIEIQPPELRANPLPRRPGMPPPPGHGHAQDVPHLEDLRYNARGETPPMGPPGTGGWDQPPDDFDEVPPRTTLREAMRSASDSLPGSRARTHSRAGTHSPGGGTPRAGQPMVPPVLPPHTIVDLGEGVPEVPPLEPLVAPAAAPAAPKRARARRRGSKDLADVDLEAEQQAGAETAARMQELMEAGQAPTAERSDLRDAGTEGGPPPLPPPFDQSEQPP